MQKKAIAIHIEKNTKYEVFKNFIINQKFSFFCIHLYGIVYSLMFLISSLWTNNSLQNSFFTSTFSTMRKENFEKIKY